MSGSALAQKPSGQARASFGVLRRRKVWKSMGPRSGGPKIRDQTSSIPPGSDPRRARPTKPSANNAPPTTAIQNPVFSIAEPQSVSLTAARRLQPQDAAAGVVGQQVHEPIRTGRDIADALAHRDALFTRHARSVEGKPRQGLGGEAREQQV